MSIFVIIALAMSSISLFHSIYTIVKINKLEEKVDSVQRFTGEIVKKENQ